MKTIKTIFAILLVTALSGCGGGGGGNDGQSNKSPNSSNTYVFSVTTLSQGSMLNAPKQIAFSIDPITHTLTDDLYVANYGDNKIIKVDASGNQTQYGPNLNSRPLGIAFDISNQMYVSTFGGDIYRVNSINAISTGVNCNCYGLATDGSTLYWVNGAYVYRNLASPQSISISLSPAGLTFFNSTLYVTRNTATTDAVQKISSTAFTQPPTNVGDSSYVFNGANGIAVDSLGNIYVVNEHVPSVIKISVSSGVVSQFLTSSNGLCSPVGLAIKGSNLYISNGCTGAGAGNAPSISPSILKVSIDLTS